MREAVFMTMIMVTINAGLLLTTPSFSSSSAFNFFPIPVNQVLPVNASSNLNPGTADTILDGGSGINIFGFASWLFSLGINSVKILVFLLTGSIQIALFLDPSASWIGVIIAPIAVLNTFGVVFLIGAMIGFLRGAS